MTLSRSQINLSRMLEQVVSESEVLLEEKGLRWKADIQPGVYMSGDADKLQRVFDNLIRNAVSYSYPDTVLEMRMRLTDSRDSGRRNRETDGAGLEKLRKLFDQFYRLDESRGTDGGGAGLGLAIAKEIVELHGGTITAESENESITFSVKLPA